MADVVEKIKGGDDLKFLGFSKSEEKDFRINGHDCAVYAYKIDDASNTLPNIFAFQTDLKRVFAGKVVKLGDNGVADATISVVPHPDGRGKLKITGLDAYAARQVFTIVAIGSRV